MVESNGRPNDQQSDFVLGLDLDGVCADFYGALRPIAAEWLGVSVDELTEDVTYGLPEWGLDSMGGYNPLHRFAITQRQLFAKMPPIPGAAAALRRLSWTHHVRIRILTHRLFIKHFHQVAATQTIAWLERHGIPYWDLCLLKDKADVGADLYIEDAPENIEALRAKDLHTIVFSNSTNTHLPGPRARNWQEAEKLVLEAVAEWREAHKASASTPLR